MALSKKNYEEFAEMIAQLQVNRDNYGPESTLPFLYDLLITFFEEDNPRFNRDTFISAVQERYQSLTERF